MIYDHRPPGFSCYGKTPLTAQLLEVVVTCAYLLLSVRWQSWLPCLPRCSVCFNSKLPLFQRAFRHERPPNQ